MKDKEDRFMTMKKLFPCMLALVMCMMMLFLSVAPTTALADGSCTKKCSQISRIVTKSNTITSSWPFYAKDQFTLYLDKAGNIAGYNVVAVKRDCRPFIMLENTNTKVISSCKNYIIVESTWSVGTGCKKFNLDIVTRTYRYRVWKTGRVERLK